MSAKESTYRGIDSSEVRLTSLYRCYIDESGDEGFKFDRGSLPWFFLGAVIVRDSDDEVVRGVIDELRERIWTHRGQQPPAALHWKEIDHNKKIVVAKALAEEPFVCIAAGIWKTKLEAAHCLRRSDWLYRYTARFLLERVSWYVHEHGGQAEIVFSNRNRFQIELLQAYIAEILQTNEHQIKPVFSAQEIRVRNANQLKMLQVADCCASAIGAAFNPDYYGNYQPYYLQILQDRLYRRNGNLLSYGLKMFPERTFLAEYPAEYPFMKGIL